MDIAKRKSKMHYQYVIIGAGIAGLGAALALEKQNKDYCFVSNNKNLKHHYPNHQLITTDELGGASKYWHGVIPLGVRNDSLFRGLFTKFYDIKNYKDHERLFIPKKPIRTSNWIDTNKLFESEVKHLTKNVESTIVHLKDGREFTCDKIIIAAGVRSTYRLLEASALVKNNSASIDDHICGYAAIVSKQQLMEIFNISGKTQKTKSGYSVEYFHDQEFKILYTVRPAIFEMKNDLNQVRGGPIYGKTSKIRLIINILIKAKLGRLLEAIGLKTGMFFNTRYYSIHFQASEEEVHFMKNNKWEVKTNLDNVFVRIEKSAEKYDLPLSKLFRHQNLYYGNHLYNLSKIKKSHPIWDDIIIVDASITKDAGATHHTFRQLVKAYEIIEKHSTRNNSISFNCLSN